MVNSNIIGVLFRHINCLSLAVFKISNTPARHYKTIKLCMWQLLVIEQFISPTLDTNPGFALCGLSRRGLTRLLFHCLGSGRCCYVWCDTNSIWIWGYYSGVTDEPVRAEPAGEECQVSSHLCPWSVYNLSVCDMKHSGWFKTITLLVICAHNTLCYITLHHMLIKCLR